MGYFIPSFLSPLSLLSLATFLTSNVGCPAVFRESVIFFCILVVQWLHAFPQQYSFKFL
ncbi:unnamed protein product [Moneuplotes crassus]|uniref:Uncharacterized protein n=1 Tax=Euplotes crassus TaxID=5936 RepID=A0AAD1XVM8_EUPCR|nr:unnamed protein product [Moneuplotes crassus]